MPENHGRPVAVIVEPNSGGHRLFYVDLIADAFRSAHYEVVLALHPATSTDALDIHLKVANHELRRIPVTSSSVSVLEEIARTQIADIVVVPDGDSVALELGKGKRWRAQAALTVLVMRERSQSYHVVVRGVQTAIKRFLFVAADRQRRVRVLFLRSALWEGQDPRGVADPVSLVATRSDAKDFRQAHRLSDDRYWFGVLGTITTRKNLPTIVAGLMSQSPKSIGLLLAGRMDDTTRRWVASREADLLRSGIEVRVIDRLLSDREIDAAVAASDCLVVALSNEGPSGLVGKAAAAGTRLVLAGSKSLKRDAFRLRSTASWSRLSQVAIAQNLGDAATQPRPVALKIETLKRFGHAFLPTSER